ncbi:MAG: sigma-70 family RNA polymerase sigma factor [Microbacteriaceae bacterium]|nr:sigma-70 family RNA polymerase sigma factor [Microbacteriaceae bacterium]
MTTRTPGDTDTDTDPRVGAAMRTLPDEQRAVLWYLDVEGLDHRQLARYLGVSHSEAAVIAHRARRALRTATRECAGT